MKIKIIIFLIILLSLFLRFYRGDQSPGSLYWDEVSIGYNAYSVLQTGKDEWGRIIPWFFEAFGEFKFPAAIYLTVIPIKIFGLTDFAVRFPSALFGGLSALMIYFLGMQIFQKRKIALLSAFLFCISPWSIQFSRAMFESNLAVLFLIAALYFLFLILKKNTFIRVFCYLASSFFCIYSYATMLVVLPLLTVLTVFVFTPHKITEKIKRTFLLSIIILPLYIPFVLHVQQDSYLRFNQVSIFSQNPVLEKVINLRAQYGGISKIILNQYSAALINFGKNFIDHINPQFLWPGKDGNPRHYNGFGLIYPIEFIFLLAGTIFPFLSKRKIAVYLIIFFMIPLAVSSFTKDSPHALRSLSCVIPVSLIAAERISFLLKKKITKILTIFAYLILINFYLVKYYDNSRQTFSAWGMENKLMMQEAKKINLKNKTVYFTGDYWRPYIYYYFYYKIDPSFVMRNNNSTRIGNVWFGYAKWDKADRRYDFNFKPENLFSKKNPVLFLSASEKTFFSKQLTQNNICLDRDYYFNDRYLFSIYEKK